MIREQNISAMPGEQPATKRERLMGTIRILGILAALLATTCVVTSASACPAKYFRCGSACCPGH